MPKVDILFPLRGSTHIPADHGYHFYSAASKKLDWLHGDRETAVITARGPRMQNHLLIRRGSRVGLRTDIQNLASVQELCGQVIQLGEVQVRLGFPTIYPVRPAQELDATRVNVKLAVRPLWPTGKQNIPETEKCTLEAIERQLKELGVSCEVEIRGQDSIVIKGSKMVCFSMRLKNFASPEQSVIIQERGLGGKRSVGCGVFTPVPWAQNA